MANELLKQEQAQELTRQNQPVEMFGSSIFSSITDFQNAQRMVKPLADSALVPDVFRGKIGEIPGNVLRCQPSKEEPRLVNDAQHR